MVLVIWGFLDDDFLMINLFFGEKTGAPITEEHHHQKQSKAAEINNNNSGEEKMPSKTKVAVKLN